MSIQDLINRTIIASPCAKLDLISLRDIKQEKQDKLKSEKIRPPFINAIIKELGKEIFELNIAINNL